VLIDEKSNKQQYIFERDGNLIMSFNGKVQYGKWRYIPAARSLVIDRGESDSLLLNHAFVNQGACILKKDGNMEDPWILVNENVVPDLDLEKYLYSLLPENKSIRKLELEGETLYYSDPNQIIGPYVGLKVNRFKDDSLITGTYKIEIIFFFYRKWCDKKNLY